MKNYKHLLAGALAAVMVLGSSVVAMADEGSTTGQGSLDIVKESDIFNVVLPVVEEEGSVFDYILDPTGVIAATNADKYSNANFEADQTLYFAVTGEDNDYAHKSDTLTATNKSTMDVEISVTASVAEVAGITMAEDAASVSDGDAALYLGLFDDAEKTEGVAITVEGVEATATIGGADDQYQIKYIAEGDYYEKVLKDDASDFDTYNFYLEGACSANGWEGLSENPPAVEVVWTIENPVVTGPTVKLTAGGLITVSGLTGDKNVLGHTSISLTNGSETAILNNKTATFSAEAGWTATEGGTCTFQLLSPYAVWNGQKVNVIVTLTDADHTKITSNTVTLNLQ